MADYEQPDSTTTSEQPEVAVANDLISLGDESSEAAHVEEVKRNDDHKPKKVSTPVVEEKSCKPCSEAVDEGCPVCHFIDYVGHVTPPAAYDIFVWKDVYKTAVIFFTILPLLVLYCYCNPIVVTAYLLLGLVTSTFTYRIYRYVIDSFQKSEVCHPFLGFGDLEESTIRQNIIELTDRALPVLVRSANKLKHYVLVEEVMDTVKFAVLLYVTAVVGGYFSLRLLTILAFVGAFTLPKVYSLYKPQITDGMQNVHKMVKAGIKEAKHKIRDVRSQVTASISKKHN